MAYRTSFANTAAGRVLLALRAGDVERHALEERLGEVVAGHGLTAARKSGLVQARPLPEWRTTIYSLTDAGKKACPCRRDQRRKSA